MKKILSRILVVTLLLALLFTTACNFVKDKDNKEDEKNTPYVGLERILKDSNTLSSDIIFNTERSQTAMPKSIEEACEEVRATSVYLFVENSSGKYNGSGVIVDVDDGINDPGIYYIITCNHMVSEKGSKITVILPDLDYKYNNSGYKFTGKIGGEIEENQEISLVGGDFTSDIAVLKLNTFGRKIRVNKAKIMSEQYSLSLAEEVFAIGTNGGEPGTFTKGWIANNNIIKTNVSTIGYMSLIRIQVPTNHGSSGGGLYNLYGELVGITNAGNDDYQEMNYIIPHYIPSEESGAGNGFISIAKQLIGTAKSVDFKNYGYVSGKREKIGISTQNAEGGVNITSVVKGGQAESLGIKAGDKITAVQINDGQIKTVTSANNEGDFTSFSYILSTTSVGDKFTVYVDRNSVNAVKSLSFDFKIYAYFYCDTGVYLEDNI